MYLKQMLAMTLRFRYFWPTRCGVAKVLPLPPLQNYDDTRKIVSIQSYLVSAVVKGAIFFGVLSKMKHGFSIRRHTPSAIGEVRCL